MLLDFIHIMLLKKFKSKIKPPCPVWEARDEMAQIGDVATAGKELVRDILLMFTQQCTEVYVWFMLNKQIKTIITAHW